MKTNEILNLIRDIRTSPPPKKGRGDFDPKLHDKYNHLIEALRKHGKLETIIWEELGSFVFKREFSSVLIHKGYHCLREYLAKRKDLPKPWMKKLAKDDNTFVVAGLAGNPSLDEDTVDLLLESENYWVHENIANNLSISQNARNHAWDYYYR
ncbi:hypothetical protein GF420_15615 [candidate division GN15 bacterium]|nr:hypothetical protein [candidate division GN15 bacterium]